MGWAAAVPILTTAASLGFQSQQNAKNRKWAESGDVVTYHKVKLPSGAVVTVPHFSGRAASSGDNTSGGIASGLSTLGMLASTNADGSTDASTDLVSKYKNSFGYKSDYYTPYTDYVTTRE